MKIRLLKFMVGCCLVSLFTSCPSKDCYGIRDAEEHVLQINLSVGPVKEAYRVGDTLKVMVSFPEDILETVTQVRYQLPEDYPYLSNAFVRIADSIPADRISYRVDSFVTIVDLEGMYDKYGSYINQGINGSNLLSQFSYDPSLRTYSINYQLVLNERGTYVLVNRTNIGDVDLFGDLQLEGLCEDIEITSVVQLDESIDANVHLLEGTEVPLYINVLIDRSRTRFDEFGSYVFRVE